MVPNGAACAKSIRSNCPPCIPCQRISKAWVSSATAFATSRVPGVTLSQIACNTSSDAPPPRKTAAGRGRSASASGAVPCTQRIRPARPKRRAFSVILSQRLSRGSIAMDCACGAARHHSTETEPDPPPTSHSSSPARGANAASVNARIGDLVIWLSWAKSAASRPGAWLIPAPPDTAVATTTGAAMPSRSNVAASAARAISRGPPSASITVRRDAPKPCAVR